MYITPVSSYTKVSLGTVLGKSTEMCADAVLSASVYTSGMLSILGEPERSHREQVVGLR